MLLSTGNYKNDPRLNNIINIENNNIIDICLNTGRIIDNMSFYEKNKILFPPKFIKIIEKIYNIPKEILLKIMSNYIDNNDIGVGYFFQHLFDRLELELISLKIDTRRGKLLGLPVKILFYVIGNNYFYSFCHKETSMNNMNNYCF